MATALDDSDFEVEETDELTEQFNSAANHVKDLIGKLSEKQLLQLYGAYKQATAGKCNTPRPRWYEMQAKAKWDAWNALDDMPQEKAKACYVTMVQSFDPGWEPSQKSAKSGESWAAVSSPVFSDVYIEEDDKTLIDFVKDGNVNKVDAMLKAIGHNNAQFQHQLNDLDSDGMALIHWAADRGNVDMLKCLLDYKADVNCTDSCGQTALHYAASCGHVECVKFLIDSGIDLDVQDEDGCSAVDVSSEEHVKELLRACV